MISVLGELWFDAETARNLAENAKPKHMLDAEAKLPIVLELVKDAASRGEMECVVDLTSDVKSYYPNNRYWHLQHDPFRICLTKLLRSRGFKVKHDTSYGTSWHDNTVTVSLKISWWGGNHGKSTEMCCGGCNNTFCKKQE